MTPDQTLRILQMIIDLNMWQGNPAMIEGILYAYIQAIFTLQRVRYFGTPEYWTAVGLMLFLPPPPPPPTPPPPYNEDTDYGEDDNDSIG